MGLFDDYLTQEVATPPGVPRITVGPGSVERAPIPPEGRQLLDTIAASESPGYNVKYGGGTFNDFADHPRDAVPIPTGPNAGKTSSAAGRYQFLGSTWDQVKKEAGLPDFSPESQDNGAWYLANKTYQQRTGRDLTQDLQSAKGNPNAIKQIGGALSGVWTSLPGGQEPNRATASFASRYDGGTAPTDFSAQSRQPAPGIFGDYLAPQGQVAAPPASGPPPALAGGEQFAPRVAREGMSEPTPPPTGALEAGARGAATGVTANFYDELRGLMEAGGLNPKDPASLGALLSGAYKYWTGDQKAAETYDMTVARERGITHKAETDQPAASIAGNIVGGAALPLGAAARGATLAERATQGARVGAAMGGLSGVGGGEDTAGRVAGGAIGAGAGAAIGAAAPAVIEGAVRTGRAIATPIANAVRGIRDPEGEAARRVAGAIQNDMRTTATPGLTGQEFVASRNAGGPAAVIDLGGETTRALARSAANTSPEGRQALNAAINDRFESQSDRVTGWLNRTFGPSDTGATREALQHQAAQANRPAYARAYGDPQAQSLWNNGFEQIAQAPVVQDAIRGATRTASNRAAAEGFTPVRNPFRFDEQSQRMVLSDPNVRPNLQFWDHVKRNLDDTVTRLQRSGENSAARDAIQLRTALVGRLDQAVPSFQAARAGAARFFGADDALTAGERFLTSNAPLNESRRAFAAMSPPERELFRQGFVQSLTQKIESTGDRRSVLNSIAQSPRAQQQIELAMGPQRAREFEAMMRVEGVMDLARGAVQGNSTTARQLTELGLAGGTYGIGTGFDVMNPNPSALMSAALVYGAARGRTRINENLSRHVAEMLTSNDPAVLRRGVAMVARNQNIMSSLRAFDTSAARVGSQQAPGIPAIQAAGIGRADEQQPDVPRPPGQ